MARRHGDDKLRVAVREGVGKGSGEGCRQLALKRLHECVPLHGGIQSGGAQVHAEVGGGGAGTAIEHVQFIERIRLFLAVGGWDFLIGEHIGGDVDNVGHGWEFERFVRALLHHPHILVSGKGDVRAGVFAHALLL